MYKVARFDIPDIQHGDNILHIEFVYNEYNNELLLWELLDSQDNKYTNNLSSKDVVDMEDFIEQLLKEDNEFIL